MYGTERVTVSFPDDLKQRLEEVAERESRSEASIVREAVQAALDERDAPVPKLPLFDGWGDPTLADRADELLAGSGFGV